MSELGEREVKNAKTRWTMEYDNGHLGFLFFLADDGDMCRTRRKREKRPTGPRQHTNPKSPNRSVLNFTHFY